MVGYRDNSTLTKAGRALRPVGALFKHLGDRNRLCQDLFRPVIVHRIDDQDPEIKTFPLNKYTFGVVDMQHGVHPVRELRGFSLQREVFYDFLMLILVNDQIQLEAVEVEQSFNVFGLAVGSGVNSYLPAIISQLVEKIDGPVAQGFDVKPLMVPG